MFDGPANLMMKNTQTKRVFWAAGTLLLLVAAALVLLPIPRDTKRTAAYMAAAAMLAIYPLMLSRSFKPKFRSVALHVDQSGIYADGAPWARREDIAQAYIRPAFEKRTIRNSGYRSSFGYYSFNITTPSFPLTVELVTRDGGDLHIDPGGQEAAASILTALGFPVTMSAPQDAPENRAMKTTGRVWIKTVLVVVLVLGALFGYAYYMYYKTQHGG
ncbi:MAG: hypothetical protein QOH57_2558 [Mycobacterium sp.]|jgi:hypothetical protein|nr:hypothetical protein [Mycobacterium sp.]